MSKHEPTMIYHMGWFAKSHGSEIQPSKDCGKILEVGSITIHSHHPQPWPQKSPPKEKKTYQAVGRKDVSDQMSQDEWQLRTLPLPLLGGGSKRCYGDSKGLGTSTFSNHHDLIRFGDLFGWSPPSQAPFHVMSIENFFDSARLTST